MALLLALGLTASTLFGSTSPEAEPTPDSVRTEQVRVTYYTLPGIMASGSRVHLGAAACSKWMPFGTILEFWDGWQVTCLDRGDGDRYWAGWVDVWAPSRSWALFNIVRCYGDYTTVKVRRWGWGGAESLPDV